MRIIDLASSNLVVNQKHGNRWESYVSDMFLISLIKSLLHNCVSGFVICEKCFWSSARILMNLKDWFEMKPKVVVASNNLVFELYNWSKVFNGMWLYSA